MKYIGVDMSKNSPGVCIYDADTQQYRFLSFIRGQNKGKISAHYKTMTDRGVEIYFYERPQPANMEYSESERWKANDAAEMAEWVVSHLPEEADAVAIEGFSYGSSGNAFIDIVGYGYAVRIALIKKYGKEKFNVFSPGNVKKTAGKGNANKEKIMEFFMELQTDICDTEFWKGLKSGEIDKVKKPTDDITDAFYVLKSIQTPA